MASLTKEMQDLFGSIDLFPFATASADGIPNVVPVKFVRIRDTQTLWIMDNFFNKTLANLRENPRAALYLWTPHSTCCVQVKGNTEILASGADYEEMRRHVVEVRPDAPARSLVILSITYVYDCMPGPDAGALLPLA